MYSTGIGVNASQAKININIIKMLNINLIKINVHVCVVIMSQYLCGTEMCASINRLVGNVCNTVL